MNKWTSRKLWVAIGTIVSIVVIDLLGLDLSRESIIEMVSLAGLYIVGQAVVDTRK